MKTYPSHEPDLLALKRAEGQIRGIQRMVEEKKYCVEILDQIHAVIAALASIEDKILQRHFEHCVVSAIQGSSAAEKARKISEVLQLVKKFRKT